MNLSDVFQRENPPRPWSAGETIPWHDPAFSQRMLKQHLSQKHDAASRRTALVKKHVAWIHDHVLREKPSCILDLGCGPGLYTSRLARLGHTCHGIDISPASIKYAAGHAPHGCTYALGDIRDTDFGDGYDLVMFIFGEFNVFSPADARSLLERTCSALNPGGVLVLEVITYDAVYESGVQPATWYSSENDLLADAPHLCLMESFWDEGKAVALERYYIVDVASNEVTDYSISTQAYTDEQLDGMLTRAGYARVERYPSLMGVEHAGQRDLCVLVAGKKEAV